MNGRSPEDVRELRPRLLRLVRRIAPPYLQPFVEDLTQDAAWRLIRGNPEWTWEDALLYRVAYSVVIDEIRRRRIHSEVAMTPSMPDRLVNSAELFPDTQVNGKQLGEGIIEALSHLVEARRHAVTLYLQGHTHAQIGEMLDCDTKSASNAIYRGLLDLRGHLTRMGFDPDSQRGAAP